VTRRVAICTVLVAVAGSAAAVALPANHDFNGHIKGDPSPGSAFAFDTGKVDGKKYVGQIQASGLDYKCPEGSPGETQAVTIQKAFKVNRHREWGGKADAIIGNTDPPARVEGKLKPGGKAAGTFRMKGELDPDGQPGVDCKTGLLEWKAKKGPPAT
jgi:hypothetical protein